MARTEEDSKKPNQSFGKDNGRMKAVHDSGSERRLRSHTANGTLTENSQKGVKKLLRRINSRGSSRTKNQDNYLHRCVSIDMTESGAILNDEQVEDARVTWSDLDAERCGREAPADMSKDSRDEMDDSDWEDGSLPRLDLADNHPDDHCKGVTVEFSESPDSAKRKPVRRASAEDKELAELVHKVHLLCLLARGRLIDGACDDPLIQASLLSLLPTHLLMISGVSKLTANDLNPLVNWFHSNFHVRGLDSAEKSFRSGLAFALESRGGTPEEIAALSVALFRGLKLTTRFVSILDVASLKPDGQKCEFSIHDASTVRKGIFSTSTLMVAKPRQFTLSPGKSFRCNEKEIACDTSLRDSSKNKESYTTCTNTQSKDSPNTDCEAHDIPDSCLTNRSPGSKRKGDLELQMQLEMAISATAVGTHENNYESAVKNLRSNSSNASSSHKRIKRIQSVESSTSSQGISTAVGSKKLGSPLYWAEVYCSGENLTGKWVHVDAVNAIIDGEDKVEAATAACKTPLRYAVAFSGSGAKDVTRRYCMKWYKIASKRVNPIWWDAVLAPLRQLESGAAGDVVHLDKHHVDALNEHEKITASRKSDDPIKDASRDHVNMPTELGLEASKDNDRKTSAEFSVRNSFAATRTSLEDMELETRTLTEPLPTSQQAYKNHELYAMERWLTKYQILHPKGPVLGFCSGHPVYPRTCVQTLKTKQRWLREGLQVKANELPVKGLENLAKLKKLQVSEAEEYDEYDSKGIMQLYGKWQLEPICLPHAVNGIVPKNERGQVEVWSEKCLPPGTVHLRLQRVFSVAKRLEIDYAPAMVGFEFRNGRSIPVFDGIVVCAEYEDVILEAYAEEEEMREAEEKKRNESQALSRWYQLLSSVVTRQKLNHCYGDGLSSGTSKNVQTMGNKLNARVDGSLDDRQQLGFQLRDVPDSKLNGPLVAPTEDHEHVYLTEEQSSDEESMVRIKRCHCGFSVHVEEL
ncbi:Rad4 domain-containing protein/BHD_1 domain-containing protein/BHD_2 domain-containing protein/BHD_3 domain-containing protein [Cephalotus follicularis]|uniref:Rad4 domain-containing protein/BHD_1 domain-containing protein/BHD_2 domain-containing protein/BHD_3 domain-containing protein n=1 Tax=Cephalotus follicularis TaxID=3775 RepID=A0A1Q3C9F6_CEPFO|nr:Rad4 domain-containing protein/BHD_1 domain-containing protein/BHD_2 domain-containing protein/BHD_3 domain-containing protein [Cephalotus follicularis]